MRTNKAILDEAARSVRRTFIGSVAGTIGMFAVVGAAGAYGMPENLTAQALSAAMARFNLKFPSEPVQAEPAVVVAQLVPKTQRQVVSQVSAAPPKTSIVSEPPIAPVVSRTPDPLPVREASVPELPPIVAAVEPAQELAPNWTASLTHTLMATPVVFKAPKVTAGVMPPALTDIAEQSPPAPAPKMTTSVTPPEQPVAAAPAAVVSAPMVFEPPKPADAQVLTELPKTEIVVASLAAEPLPVALSKDVSQDLPQDLPKSVMIALPLPKPPLTPAQRLDLQGKDYDKAEKCLAQAVYFEARNEPARGQEAVAQVVLNRVFSPYYPKDVCSVVYQNAHHYLGCQFTFACDGKPESVNERGPWARASRIAKLALDAEIWLPDVSKATHYHAAYVHPRWIRDMKVLARYGLHTFYRPRNWGDGSDEAHWGTPANSAKPAAVTAVKALTPTQKKFAYR